MMRSTAFVLSVLMAIGLMATFSSAQIEWTAHQIYPWYEQDVVPADLDNDGDLDIWGIGYLDVAWYENNGYQSFQMHMVYDQWNYGIMGAVADLDGDGDLDGLGSGWLGNEIAWFENDGNGNFTYTPIAAIPYAWSVAPADLDEDGDMDVVITGDIATGRLAWYENDGNANFTAHIIVQPLSYPRSAQVIDVDEDTDLDIVTCGGMSVRWYENDGSQNFTEHIVGTITQNISKVLAVDLDLDTDLDLVMCSFWADIINWYENDGNQNFTLHNLAIALDGPDGFDVADFDNDGDLDVVSFSAMQDYYCWYENQNLNFLQHVLPEWFDYPVCVKAVDMEEDGDMDFIGTNNEDRFQWFENTLLAPYDLTLTLTPSSTPVQVPPGGGSFNYELELENSDNVTFTVDVWLDITLPGGNIYPVLTRTNLTLAPGATIVRNLTQNVPGSAMPGNYSYNGHVRDHNTWFVYAEASFPFEKLAGFAVDNSNLGWALFGWDEDIAVTSAVPDNYALDAPYPNPFNPETILRIALPVAGHATLVVFDTQGREVARLLDRDCSAGWHDAVFSGAHLTSGTYFVRLVAGDFQQTQKLLLVK